MKFQTQDYHTSQSSNISGQAFQVSMTAKFFETLFSGLYRYKEAAVIRELFCNAIDTHRMRDMMYRIIPSHYAAVGSIQRNVVNKHLAPLATPVEIHLPDAYEPWLEIKDWGMGLSLEKIIGEPIPAEEGQVLIEGNIPVKEDEIPEGKGVIAEPGWYQGQLVFRSPDNNEIIRTGGLYTTMFESTKGDSNDQIGAFGLGSKSPFAISDSFTVEARYDGELYNFLMYLNEKRIPCVELTSKDLETRDPKPEATEDYNGLTVRVPVRQSQYAKFADQLSDLCRVLLPHEYPVVKNDSYFDGFTPIDRSNRIDNTYIQQAKRQSHASTHYAVMGGVAYPIELGQINDEIRALLERFPSTYTFFPLGSLNVPPSREDLSYDQFTRACLNDVLANLQKAILQQAMGDLTLAQKRGPIWLAMMKNEYKDKFGEGFKKAMDEKFPTDWRFQKNNIGTPMLQPEIDYDLPQVKEVFDYKYLMGSSGSKSFYNIVRYTSHSRDEDSAITISTLSQHLRENTKPVMIILDNHRCYAQKIKQYLARNPDVNCVWLIFPNHQNLISWRDMDLATQYKNHKELKDEITKWVGNDKTVNWLTYADQLAEYYEGLINPEILFMSELPFETLKITGDIGMMWARGTKQVGADRWKTRTELEGYSFTSEQIMKVAENGRKMVYVSYSGHSMSHENMTPSVAAQFMELIGGMQIPDVDNPGSYINLPQSFGWHDKLLIARKKAEPFLKANSDFFVDINDALAALYVKYKDILEAIEYDRFAGTRSLLKMAKGRIEYVRWVLEQIGGKFDTASTRDIDKLCVQSYEVEAKLRDSYDFTIKCAHDFERIVKEYGVGDFFENKGHFKDMRNMLRIHYKFNDMDTELRQCSDAYPAFERLTDELAGIIRVNANELAGRGHERLSAFRAEWRKGESRGRRVNKHKESRRHVRTGIEAYKILDYVNKTYQGTMANKLDEPEALKDAIIKRIKTQLNY